MSEKINKENGKLEVSVFYEVLIFFLVGTIIIGIVSWFTISSISKRNIMTQKVHQAENLFDDLGAYLCQYESIDYIMEYWLEHLDDLDVEYDSKELTREKAKKFLKDNPGFSFTTATIADIDNLSEADKKAYAEIVYNNCLIRMNNMLIAYKINYIYCMAADNDFQKCIFLLNGSDGKGKRSNNFGDYYLLGTTVTFTESQRELLKQTIRDSYSMAESNGYVDRYEPLFYIDGYHVFLGLTYSIQEVNKEILGATVQGTMYVLLFQLIFAIVCLIFIKVYVTIPLRTVKNNVDYYEDTKNSAEVVKNLSRVKLNNEIGRLSESFSNMALEIDNYIKEVKKVTAEKERIGAELNVATRIQEDMLPREFPPFPDRTEFDIYANMDPAKEVGGDFYDFFFVDDDHLALVIADVSGKGVPAALFMVIAKTLIKIRTSSKKGSPAEIFYDVNNTLCEGNNEQFFVTVWLAVINLKTGEGIAANAGHEHPILRHKGGEFEPVIYKHSQPLGMLEDMKFREHEFKLEPGASLFVYTDGVTEAENTCHELFGVDRVATALNKCKSDDPKELIDTVRKDIDEFVGEADQFDDITMLSFFYRG